MSSILHTTNKSLLSPLKSFPFPWHFYQRSARSIQLFWLRLYQGLGGKDMVEPQEEDIPVAMVEVGGCNMI